MDLLALADFHLVVTHGGIGRASRASGRPKATLSRRVMELEESLGVRLLDRGSRSLRLTEEGGTLHARTKGLLGEIVEIGEAISEGIARPRGRLRIISPLQFAHTSFGPIAAAFIRAYPEVRLEITAEDRAVDPVEEGYDLVIRANPAPDDKLVGRCFLQESCWGEALDQRVAVWVLHTPGRLVSSKVAAFVKFLCAAFSGPSQ
jgi:DNA-binding transcriptional LysR family regulator